VLSYEDMMAACSVSQTYGHYFLTICPFHEDQDPSLMVFKDGWFRCLGCDRSGSWKTLWNKLHGQPVQLMPERRIAWNTPRVDAEDLETLCYDAHDDLLQFPSLGWYLEIRGIQDRIEVNELGYWDGWYTIPVKDRHGNFITAILRSAPHIQEATGLRYWCHHTPVPFCPDWNLVERNDYLYVVYGAIDALVLADLRLPVMTSSAGKDSFRPEWLDDQRKEIIIIPDKPLNEVESAKTLAGKLGWRGRVRVLDYPEGLKDCADYYKAGRKEELQSLLGKETR
jgi:hypothetical protein